TPIDTEKKLGPEGSPVTDPTLYRSLAESLQYLTFTRPNLSYAVQQLCLYMHDPREPHLNAMKRVLRYLRGTTDLGLQLLWSTTSQFITYYDADWAGGLVMLIWVRVTRRLQRPIATLQEELYKRCMTKFRLTVFQATEPERTLGQSSSLILDSRTMVHTSVGDLSKCIQKQMSSASKNRTLYVGDIDCWTGLYVPRSLLHNLKHVAWTFRKAAILEVKVLSYKKETGEPLCMNSWQFYHKLLRVGWGDARCGIFSPKYQTGQDFVKCITVKMISK
ncbi:ribonuclease H-like domain-containing protein, partial [Tanacetum coccineum]